MSTKDNQLTDIKELLEVVKHKVDQLDMHFTGTQATLSLMRDKVSMMNGKLDDQAKELKSIKDKLNDPDNGLEAINDRVEAARASVVEIENKIEGFGDMYKMNNDNILNELGVPDIAFPDAELVETHSLGKTIRDLRIKLGMSKAAFSKTSGLDQSTIGRVERGLSISFHPETVRRMVNNLGDKISEEERQVLLDSYTK